MLKDELNFLLTNRIPRILLTQLIGWYSQIKSKPLTRFSIWIWNKFTPLDLSESLLQDFESLQQVFTRKLKPDARIINNNPTIVVSPCDCILGETGLVTGGQLFQIKGMQYELVDLLAGNKNLAVELEGHLYLTMRLTSVMYHRFHAPCDCTLTHVSYITGDTWNVNPIALKKIERLFCRNQRAVLHFDSEWGKFYLVPVAAILVAGIYLNALDRVMDTSYNGSLELGLNQFYAKGQELGWFQHGSTIIMIFPAAMCHTVALEIGHQLKFGQGILSLDK